MTTAIHSDPATQPQSTDRIGVSVCIPAYNEAGVIASTIEEAAGVLASLPGRHEIVVVDDGSDDETWRVLSNLEGSCPLLRALRHSRNRGIAAAQRTLVEAARGEFIFHIGADRQWRMDELARMLEAIKEHDIVVGVRTKKQYTIWRQLVSACFNGSVALLWGKHFGDLGSIKLVRSQLWKQVPFGSSSAFVHAQRLLIAYHNGARITTTPVEHLPRCCGSSKFTSPGQALWALLELLRFRCSAASKYRLPDDWRQRQVVS